MFSRKVEKLEMRCNWGKKFIEYKFLNSHSNGVKRLVLDCLIDLINGLIGVNDDHIAGLVVDDVERTAAGRRGHVAVEPALVQLVQTGQIVQVDAMNLFLAVAFTQTL